MLIPGEQTSPITAQQLEQAARKISIESLSLILFTIINIPEIVLSAELPDLQSEITKLLELLAPHSETNWDNLLEDKLLSLLAKEDPHFLVSLVRIGDDYEVFPLEAIHLLRMSGAEPVTAPEFETYIADINGAKEDLAALKDVKPQPRYAFRLNERLNRRKPQLLLMYLPELVAELGFDFKALILNPLRQREQEVGYMAEAGGFNSREAGLLVGPREVRDFMGRLRFMQEMRVRGDAVVTLAGLMEKVVFQTARYHTMLIEDLCQCTGVQLVSNDGFQLKFSQELSREQLEAWISESAFIQRCLQIAQTDYPTSFLNFSKNASEKWLSAELYSLAVALVDPAISAPASSLAFQMEKIITESLDIKSSNLYHFNQHNAANRGFRKATLDEDDS
jgi:hypothetical protein